MDSSPVSSGEGIFWIEFIYLSSHGSDGLISLEQQAELYYRYNF
jgi:hypothetical protein